MFFSNICKAHKYGTMFMSNPLHAIRNVVPKYSAPFGGPGFSTMIDSTQYVYLPILKNAHSWTQQFLKDNLGIELEENNQYVHNKKIIIVLRDPIQRWVSGIAQFMSMYDIVKCNELLNNKSFLEVLFDVCKLDLHTRLQLDDIFFVDMRKCLFFRCDNSYTGTMRSFVSTLNKTNTIIENNIYHSVTSGNESKKFVYKEMTKIISNSYYHDKISAYLLPDIQLLDYITQNNLWYTAR